MARNSRMQRQPRHHWTHQDRIILALLYRLYDNNKSDILRIFNYINHDVLVAEGFPTGSMAIAALMSQKADLKKSENPIWQRVAHTPLPLLRNRYNIEKNQIEDGAQALKIKLELKIESRPATQSVLSNTTGNTQRTDMNAGSRSDMVRREAWSPSTEPEFSAPMPVPLASRAPAINREIIRSFSYNVNTTESFVERGQDEESTDEPAATVAIPSGSRSVFDGVFVPSAPTPSAPITLPRTPSPADSLDTVRLSPKLTSESSISRYGSRNHPTLLFRAHEPHRNFVARRFQTSGVIDKPPEMKSTKYRQDIEAHLRRGTDFQSPFLSTTQKINCALKKVQESEGARNLAAFSFDDLYEEGYRKTNKITPRLVRGITEDFNLNDLPRGYLGYGEWLLWGRIDTEPVLNLESSKALELLELMEELKREQRDCDEEMAWSLLPFIREVDYYHRQYVLRALVVHFGILPSGKSYRTRAYQNFQAIACGDRNARHREERLTLDVHETHSLEHEATQRAVDAQLLNGMQAYASNHDIVDGLANRSNRACPITEMDVAVEAEGQDHDEHAVTMLNGLLANPLNPSDTNRPESDAASAKSFSSVSPVIDLTEDANDTNEIVVTEPVNDIEMVDLSDDEDEADCVLISSQVRRIGRSFSIRIRSRSRTAPQGETPSRLSRWPEYHSQVLSD